MGLTVVGAALLITGLTMVLVSEALRLNSGHGGAGLVRAGGLLACFGLAIGVALVIALTSGRPDRRRADRTPAGRSGGDRASADRARADRGVVYGGSADRASADRGGADRGGADRGWGIMRRWRAGAGARRDQAEEWLSPLHTAGGGLVPQRVQPSWQQSAEQTRTGSGDYSDDGWNPDLGDGWHPGPAYVWASGEDDDWDGQGEGDDWDPGDGWNPSAGSPVWPGDELRAPGAPGPGPVTGPRQGYLTGSHGYLNAPAPGYLAGPQPMYAAGPEPGPLSSPAPAYLTDRDAEYAVGADVGYLNAGPDSGPAGAPGSAGGPEAAYAEAAGAGVPDPGTARRDDDTSPIPVIREPGEPVPAPKPFSVWEPAPKPRLDQGPDGRPDDVYRPAHAEPPSADTQEKIEQIKDLYVTAEAIGDEALGKHFDELHQRQRSLIREFFEKAGLGPKDASTPLGDDSAQDGAPLHG